MARTVKPRPQPAARPAAKSGVRAVRAAQTRRRMVQAAYGLFCEQGFDATTMAQIADRAGVAVQTTYFAFGSKRQLLQESFALAVMGEHAQPPHMQAWWQRMERARNARSALTAVVDGAVDIFVRVSPLVTAMRATTTADADVRAVWEQQERLRRQGFSQILQVLATKQPLRRDLAHTIATDLMLVLLGPEVFRAHTQDNGWTPREYAARTIDALHRLLFEAG